MYLIVFLLAGNALTAQVIKLKKEIIYVGETPTFSFIKKAMGNELYVYKLNTKEEFVKIVVDNNNTESKVDDSKKIILTQQKNTPFISISTEDLDITPSKMAGVETTLCTTNY